MAMSGVLLLFSLLVVGAYAGVNRYGGLKHMDTCDKYERILRANRMGTRYHPCGVTDKKGRELCYLNGTECDCILDCPNQADEDRPDCKAKHLKCLPELQSKKTQDGRPVGYFRCQPKGDPEDVIHILSTKRCNGEKECPLGDDETNCP